MSVVSSVLSSRSSPPWNINVRLVSLMDSIFAIGFGLALRFVVDAVSHHDFKLTGTLVGLWEGVIMLHFLKKMPRSSDPYVAYGVRLFVDLICTESVARLALVIVWTALGMVLADVTPAIWDDVGLHHIWRRFRRDLYTMSQMIPRIAFFPPQRTVRFSPSREPSVEPSEHSPSITETPTLPPPTVIEPPAPVRRRVPGHFQTDYSDTETERSFARAGPSTGRTSRRLSVFPGPADSSFSSLDDADEGNLSSGASSSGDTERAGPSSSAAFDMSAIQDMEEEPLEEDDPATAPVSLQLDTTVTPIKPEDEELTPTPKPPYMPPTPSDSAFRIGLQRDNDPLPVRPPSELLPQIPDFLEEPATDDWDTINAHDVAGYGADAPPPLPEKDDKFKAPLAVRNRSTPSPEGWDALESQFFPRPTDTNNKDDKDPTTTTTKDLHDDPHAGDQRLSQPPPYHSTYEDFDDIYGDEAPLTTNTEFAGNTGDLLGGDVNTHDDAGARASQNAAWDESVAQFNADAEAEAEEAAKLKEEEEEAARLRAFEDEVIRLKDEADALEAAQRKKEEEVAAAEAEEAKRKAVEAQRLADEAAALEKEKEEKAQKERAKEERKRKKADEKAEREAKEAADELARQKKREEEATAEEEAKAEEKRKKAEAKEERRRKRELELEEQRKKEEAEAAQKEQEEKEAAVVAAAALAKEQEDQAKAEAEAKWLKEEEEAMKAEETRRLEKDEAKKKQEAAQPEAAPSPPDAEGHLFVSEGFNTPEPTEPAPAAEPSTPPPDTYEESVASVATAVTPQDVMERVERMLTLRAQMVDIQVQIDALKEGGEDETDVALRHAEKIMRKMRRQADRRYAAGIACAQYLGGFDDADDVTMEGLNPKMAQQKIAEKLEDLLTPTTKSLYFKITVTKSKKDAPRQKTKVVEFMDTFNLIPYTTENSNNKKISIIEIPEDKFAEWLTGYRTLATKRQQEAADENPEN